MPKPKPSARPRPGGGFNRQGMDQFSEHMDQQAMQAAMGQKQLGQQAADPSSASAAAAASKQGQQPAGASDGSRAKQPPPREVGSLSDELVMRPIKDIGRELAAFFDINTLLGIDPQTDTPEEQAKKRQLHQRWQRLNKEQQQVAQQLHQEELERKQQEEQEEQLKKEQEEKAAEQRRQAMAQQATSKSQKGPVGPGMSRKQKAKAKLDLDRQRLGGPSSIN